MLFSPCQVLFGNLPPLGNTYTNVLYLPKLLANEIAPLVPKILFLS
nr:MAG TPA: hypothetical protein [Bacteriophage sp.]